MNWIIWDDAINVKPLYDYMLEVKFETGEKKLFDFKPYLHKEIFKKFQNDVEAFEKVTIEGGIIYWDDDTDLAPERVYTDGVPVKGYIGNWKLVVMVRKLFLNVCYFLSVKY